MNIFRLLGRIGQGAFAGRRFRGITNNRMNFNPAEKENKAQEATVLTSKRINIRNGSRGEGIGMGHRNKKVAYK